MKRSEEGDYDTWGVRLPDGQVREFGTLKKATMFRDAMEGKDVINRDGEKVNWSGLTVVTRHIPQWSEVTDVTKTLSEVDDG